MKIAIAAAMVEELSPFRSFYQATTCFHRGKIKIEEVSDTQGYQLFLVETGIGKVNAGSTAAILCEQIGPDIIINTGSAGGFSNRLAVGDVVVGSSFRYSDVDATGFDYELGQVPQMPASYEVSQEWLKQIEGLPQPEGYQRLNGLVVTADSFMSNLSQVTQIKTLFPGALASDMEGTAIAQVASFYDIPVLNIRGISDIAGKDAPQAFDDNIELAAKLAFEQTVLLIRNLVASLKNES